MNLDSNHVYGNRFVRIGDKGFNPALVTSFVKTEASASEGISKSVLVSLGSDVIRFTKADADLVWDYLTANSTDLMEINTEPYDFTERHNELAREELPY